MIKKKKKNCNCNAHTDEIDDYRISQSFSNKRAVKRTNPQTDCRTKPPHLVTSFSAPALCTNTDQCTDCVLDVAQLVELLQAGLGTIGNTAGEQSLNTVY